MYLFVRRSEKGEAKSTFCKTNDPLLLLVLPPSPFATAASTALVFFWRDFKSSCGCEVEAAEEGTGAAALRNRGGTVGVTFWLLPTMIFAGAETSSAAEEVMISSFKMDIQ